ncbi:TIGR00341 family protein [Flavihumibacter rivuli]|uniref:TIGR00341 family protein n=1 Tax=Flavihumibacter rivuli TaxID=2838156 RepID=UPI001BDE4D16|nr:TIGR00341 family protein [Flavihumibacter rivuli]ULQ55645.1 TIGR00341 family protein [Flavihumibacter rivuli]
MSALLRKIKWFFWDRFNLMEDTDEFENIIEALSKGVDFKGTNLWILIFAIFIASIGLNVNATAVIIGAMLISPLMGPIMGFGLGVGIYDFELVKRALRNLAIAALLSLCTSTLYFLISPIHDAASELLARTQPTTYDVLIAFLGGLAGVVAATRKEKSNVIPGVAIATALMPPLCTAGYGLANGEWKYLMGALYLFFINSVFISLATILIVRFLKFPKVKYVNDEERKKVRSYILSISLLTLVPSIYFGYNIIQQNIYLKNASSFIEKEMSFGFSQLVKSEINTKARVISLVYIGAPLTDSLINSRKQRMPEYNLTNTQCKIRQISISDSLQVNLLKNAIREDLKGNQELSLSMEERLSRLEEAQAVMKMDTTPRNAALLQELASFNSNIKALAVEPTIIEGPSGSDTAYLVFLELRIPLNKNETQSINQWLSARLKSENIKVFSEIKP